MTESLARLVLPPNIRKVELVKRLIVCLFCSLLGSSALAATYCNGKVASVYKWNSMTSLSIQIVMPDGSTTNWISMPTRSDEAMALVALTTGKPISLYWAAADVTVCANGWLHNRVLDGFFVVTN